ncbi:hypothetical protein FNV43_RR11242 [Rhamnella rubrinervis]|uniref:F-box domain-containing protein n=1 Tax=Rhamnella rubrinervis TaxID=2594499 RepID=A0A8K0MHP0_9ROSA|nr:hypothetical protein FNV43_RR11242 [Rhamnella rubrinervis]
MFFSLGVYLDSLYNLRYDEEEAQGRRDFKQGDGYGSLKLEDLPDEIIVHILSLLPLKDAAATSILSSRWRYFWRFTRLMSLDFDFDLTDNCCAMAYDSLKVISLRAVSVSGKDVEYFLSNAPLLKRWAVRDSPNLVPRLMEDFSLRYRRVPKRPHYRLKEVEILEYSSKFGDMDRVLYLIKNTVGLQRIVINCKYNHPLRIMKTKQRLLEDEEVSRRHAMTQLQPQVPSDIQFVCI